MNRADTAALKAAMLVAADAIIAAEPELTRIDKVIGDGDHGINPTAEEGAHVTAIKDVLIPDCFQPAN